MTDTLRIATLNLWGFFGNWPARLQLLERMWADVDADVVLCQEVCCAPGLDQAAVVAQALRFEHRALALAADVDGHREGVALLSDLPLSCVTSLPLPDSTPRRVALYANVPLGVRELTVASAHAVCTPTPARCAQIQALAALALEGPVVLGADLNATPEQLAADGAQLGSLADAFADTDTRHLADFAAGAESGVA